MSKLGFGLKSNFNSVYVYHRSRRPNEYYGQAAYRADIVEEKVISTIKEFFDKIKTTPEQKIPEHKFQKQLAECKTKKKQLEQQLEKQAQQLGILQAEIGKSLSRNSVYFAEDLAEAIKIAKKNCGRINQRSRPNLRHASTSPKRCRQHPRTISTLHRMGKRVRRRYDRIEKDDYLLTVRQDRG